MCLCVSICMANAGIGSSGVVGVGSSCMASAETRMLSSRNCGCGEGKNTRWQRQTDIDR